LDYEREKMTKRKSKEDVPEGRRTESLWLEIRNEKGVITLISVLYRPLTSGKHVEEQICKKLQRKARIIE